MNSLQGKIQVDFRSSEPLYLQISRQIGQLITVGELKPGEQLPTVRELATELRINFNTVTRAYHELDDAQLISTQRGRGTFVWDTPSRETIRLMREESLKAATQRYLKEIMQLGFSLQEARELLDSQDDGGDNDLLPSVE